MNQPARKKYPIGMQSFSTMWKENYLYIDKTEYIYRMTHSDSKYMFLSRPRRFGKSLLVDTLHAYFEGKKELFEGLAIEKRETEWTQYPVLHFDFSTAKNLNKEELESELSFKLAKYEEVYGRKEGDERPNQRLQGLIERAYRQTGKEVVVLIDEYDAPLLDVMHEEKDLPVLRNVMRNFYSPLKALGAYLHFVFLTGITKFSQLSIFSELNNIQNISMLQEYAAICGITEEEIRRQMDAGLEAFAQKLSITKEEMLEKLKANYDGYHFTWPSPDIYNPYSLMNAFSETRIASYWFGSGTPTYLIEMLRKFGMSPAQLGGEMRAEASDFDAPTERLTGIVPLLYQSGYFTIKNGNLLFGSYTLGIPNREVRIGLMKSLIPYYLTPNTQATSAAVITMAECLYDNDMEGALQAMRTFLSTVPYADNTDYEGHYQQVLYIIFSLLGMYTDIEVRTPRGRVDVVMRTPAALYLIEVKMDKSADVAMQQIDLKQYPERFALCGVPIVKVGINFDSRQRTISDWTIMK